jgi:glutamate racemase
LFAKRNRPVGIFDSGIGGLTVASAIKKVLPNEHLVYFGDTAHLPYGDKSPESIRSYALEISKFLYQKGCKVILIACNTASAHAYHVVNQEFGDRVPVINVIEPVAQYVAHNYTGQRIGVIGTKGTIHSRIYPKTIQKMNRNVDVTSLATPLLASMIEEGFYNNNISQTIINSYLSRPSIKDIQALVLGCTHYPLIKHEVKKFYGKSVEIIDSAEVVARHLGFVLSSNNLLRDSDSRAENQFFVSDYTEAFEKSTRIFFRETIHLDEIRLWD